MRALPLSNFFPALFALLCLAHCSGPTADSEQQTENEVTETKTQSGEKGLTMEKNGIRLTAVEDSPGYAEARLELSSPNPEEPILQSETNFEFATSNYELGVQTADAVQKLCANSGKGQHIHFIWDNQPYAAFYEPSFTRKLDKGHHVMLAFLSRSYHESIKNHGAYVLQEFNVGGPDLADDFDEQAPHMFYSRPKGSYIGKTNMGRVMLDFYIVNADLSPKGYKVRATINEVSFILTRWVPYFIEGLKEGDNAITLEFLDANDQLVSSPYNPVKRIVTAAKEEPIPAN